MGFGFRVENRQSTQTIRQKSCHKYTGAKNAWPLKRTVMLLTVQLNNFHQPPDIYKVPELNKFQCWPRPKRFAHPNKC